MKRSSGALLSCLILAACGPAYPFHPPVPPIPAENVPAPPVSRTTLIWQPGHYDWTGQSYLWIGGRWVERAGHGALWQDGYWEQTPRGPVWVPAHWM
ncbi:MAG: YXWGXW repeat-containing protein [Acetobacteraceae bacterium]|nr:YXWGXW repeat-containing protein [Acetobacteraceae bacterium]